MSKKVAKSIAAAQRRLKKIEDLIDPYADHGPRRALQDESVWIPSEGAQVLDGTDSGADMRVEAEPISY